MATSQEKQSTFKKLFGFNIDPSATLKTARLVPTSFVRNPTTGEMTIEPTQFPSNVQELWEFWQAQCHDTYSSFEEREDMFDDMDMIFYNSPFMWRAITMRRDEAIQAETGGQVIEVEAPPDQRTFILNFLRDKGVEGLLPDIFLNLIQYGNAGVVLVLDDSGVSEIIPVDVRQIRERLEFTPHKIRQDLDAQGSLINSMYNQFDRIQTLIDSMSKDEDYGSYFKSYLFGFQVGDMVLPPWRFIHFRNFTSRSPFYPFGIPAFIHSVAPYRQFDVALSLRIAARGASFPVDKYSVKLPNIIDPTEKLNKALEFARELDNVGLRKTTREGIGIGERIVTIDELFDWNQISPQFDLGPLGELDTLENMLIISTGMPRGLLDPNASSWGDSAVSLIEQFKPFARAVYHDQTTVLQNISQIIKIHMIQSGKFKLENINFRLSMPFPESSHNRDVVGSQTDQIGLAGTILDALQTRIMGDSGIELPVEIVREVFHQVMPLEPEKIDKWVNSAISAKQQKQLADEAAANPEPGQDEAEMQFEKWHRAHARLPIVLRESFNKLNLKKITESTIFEIKQQHQREGVHRGRHYYSSHNLNRDFDVGILEKTEQNRMAKLEEQMSVEFEKFRNLTDDERKVKLDEARKKAQSKMRYKAEEVKWQDALENEIQTYRERGEDDTRDQAPAPHTW